MADPFTVPNPSLGLPATTPVDNRSLARSIIDYINERTNVYSALQGLPDISRPISRALGMPSLSQVIQSRTGVAGKRGDPSAVIGTLGTMFDILSSVAPARTAIPTHRFHSMPGLAERNILGPRGNLGSGFGELNPRTAMRGEIPVGGARGGRYPNVGDIQRLVSSEFPDYYISRDTTASGGISRAGVPYEGTRYVYISPRQLEFGLRTPRRPGAVAEDLPRTPGYKIRFPDRTNIDPQNPDYHPILARHALRDPSYLRSRFIDTASVQNPYLNAEVSRDIYGGSLSDRRNFVNELRRRLSGEPFDPLRTTEQPIEPVPGQLELPLKGPGGRPTVQQFNDHIARLNQHTINVRNSIQPLVELLRTNPNHPSRDAIVARIKNARDVLAMVQDQLHVIGNAYALRFGAHVPHGYHRNAEMSALGSRYNVDQSSGYLNPSTTPMGGGDTTYGTFLGRNIRPRHKGPGGRDSPPITEEEMRAYLGAINRQEATPEIPEPFVWQPSTRQSRPRPPPPPLTRAPYGHSSEGLSREDIIARRMHAAVLGRRTTIEAMQDPAVREYMLRMLARRSK